MILCDKAITSGLADASTSPFTIVILRDLLSSWT
jgi:hypothetical protein